MTYDPYGQYDPQRQQQPGSPGQYPGQQYPQQPPYPPQQPQQPQYPPPPPPGPYGQPPAPDPYVPPAPAGPYGQPSSPGPYEQPGSDDPTAPVSYGGGQYGSSGQYSDPQYGGTQVGGSPYSAPPFGAAPYGGGPFGSPQSPGGWPPPAPQPKRSTGLVVGLVAGGLALVLCLGGLGYFGLQALNDDPGPTDPTGSPGPVASGGPDGGETDPFAGTPAEGFSDGEAAIVVPQAEAVGDFSADQVAQALDQVKQALIATRIDSTMVVDRNPDPFIDTMAEDNREFLQEDFSSGRFGYFASQIADGAELAVPTPRAEGTVEFDAVTAEEGIRVVQVVTKFVWVYAFVPPSNDPELDGLVVVKDELTWQVPHPEDVIESSNGLWLWTGEAYAWGIACEPFDQSLLAPQTELRFDFGAGGPDEGDVFDPNSSLDYADTC